MTCVQVVLTSWLTSTYMSPRARAQVQIQMEEGSEVSLRDFLQPTKTHDLLAALDDPGSYSGQLFYLHTKHQQCPL